MVYRRGVDSGMSKQKKSSCPRSSLGTDSDRSRASNGKNTVNSIDCVYPSDHGDFSSGVRCGGGSLLAQASYVVEYDRAGPGILWVFGCDSGDVHVPSAACEGGIFAAFP